MQQCNSYKEKHIFVMSVTLSRPSFSGDQPQSPSVLIRAVELMH